VFLSRLAAIPSSSSKKACHAFALQTVPLAPQGPRRDTSTPTVGQQPFLLAQLLEIAFSLIVGNLFQPQGAQQRAPEDGPVLIVTTHRFCLRQVNGNVTRRLNLSQSKPDLVAKRGKNGSGKQLSHCSIR
jgi:hypothetical protein